MLVQGLIPKIWEQKLHHGTEANYGTAPIFPLSAAPPKADASGTERAPFVPAVLPSELGSFSQVCILWFFTAVVECCVKD